MRKEYITIWIVFENLNGIKGKYFFNQEKVHFIDVICRAIYIQLSEFLTALLQNNNAA